MKKILIASAVVLLLTAALAAQSITVTSPKYGDASTGGVERPAHWCVGETHSVLWVAQGAMQATVTIALRYSGSATDAPPALVIASGTANDGGYPWTVPNTVAPGYYFLRVRTDDATVIGDGQIFHIGSSPAMIVTSPRKTDLWCVGTKHAIQWKKWCAIPGNVTIALRTEGSPASAAPRLVIATGAVNNGYYPEWTIPNDIEAGNYFIRVRTDDATVIGDGEVFKIGKETIRVLVPNGGAHWKLGIQWKLTWDHNCEKGDVNLLLMQNGKYKGAIVRHLSSSLKSYVWTVGLLSTGKMVDPGNGFRLRVVKDYPDRLGPIPFLGPADESDGDFSITAK